jgi:hypothetical protein
LRKNGDKGWEDIIRRDREREKRSERGEQGLRKEGE